MSATGVDKVFDDTTSATANLSDNRMSGDILTTGYLAANFDSVAVGYDKTIFVTGITATGIDAGNYIYNETATALANITPDNAENIIDVLPTVPVTPFSTQNPAPIALQGDTQYGGVSTTAIQPSIQPGINIGLILETGSGYDGGPAATTLFIGIPQGDTTSLLSVIQWPRGFGLLPLHPIR